MGQSIILATKQFISICERQGTTKIFNFKDGSIFHACQLKLDVKYLASATNGRVIFNDAVYDQGLQLVEKIPINFESHRCIYYCESSDAVYYGYVSYPYITRYDMGSRHKMIIHIRDCRTKGNGIIQIESVAGMRNMIICLHSARLWKFTLDLSK